MREYHARPRLPDHGTMQQVHRELDADYQYGPKQLLPIAA